MRFLLILGIGVLVGILVVAKKIDTESISEKFDSYVEIVKGFLPAGFETPTKEELLEKKEELVLKITELKQQLEDKKDEGIEKINEIQEALAEAKASYEATKKALEDLVEAADQLKEVL